jgi:hypothetical protein
MNCKSFPVKQSGQFPLTPLLRLTYEYVTTHKQKLFMDKLKSGIRENPLSMFIPNPNYCEKIIGQCTDSVTGLFTL